MKLYEYIKDKNKRTIKIFGITFLQQTFNHMTTEKYQSFLGGIIATKRINNIQAYHIEKDIKLFGKSIIKRIEDGINKTYYCNNKVIKNIPLKNEFKKRYLKLINKKHDIIYILNANSGEIYLFLTYALNAHLKKNNAKFPLLIATRDYHVELIKMIHPEIPCILIKDLKQNIKDDSFEIDNFKFFLIFSHNHFAQVETSIKNNPLGQEHYFLHILKRLNLKQDDINMQKITVPENSEKSMFEKIDKIGLNTDNFIFLAPEARSCELIDNQFWKELIIDYKNNGFDIFVNIADESVAFNDTEYKTCTLAYSEAFALAKRAKKIISLRSGLTEFLLQTGVPMDVLYTKFKMRHFFRDLDKEHILSGFGLSQIPFIDKNNIKELIYSEQLKSSI